MWESIMRLKLPSSKDCSLVNVATGHSCRLMELPVESILANMVYERVLNSLRSRFYPLFQSQQLKTNRRVSLDTTLYSPQQCGLINLKSLFSGNLLGRRFPFIA